MITGTFSSRRLAGDAITELTRLGFTDTISVFVKGWDGSPMESMEDLRDGLADTVREVVVGGLAGMVVGISVFFVPGIGTLLIAGPLASFMTASGALSGGLSGFLADAGIPKNAAVRYQDALAKGDILIIVRTQPGEEKMIGTILDRYGQTGWDRVPQHGPVM